MPRALAVQFDADSTTFYSLADGTRVEQNFSPPAQQVRATGLPGGGEINVFHDCSIVVLPGGTGGDGNSVQCNATGTVIVKVTNTGYKVQLDSQGVLIETRADGAVLQTNMRDASLPSMRCFTHSGELCWLADEEKAPPGFGIEAVGAS